MGHAVIMKSSMIGWCPEAHVVSDATVKSTDFSI